MTSKILRREDADFLLYDWLAAERLLTQPRYCAHSRETFDGFLDLCADLARDAFLPCFKTSDEFEIKLADGEVTVLPQLAEALQQYAELGLSAASFPEERGGAGLPFLISTAGLAWFAAANFSATAYALLTAANARLIAAFGSDEQISTFALPQIEGRWFGTMCLSEPQAGSSLADVLTKAWPDGRDYLGDRYRLHGNKMWISGGAHDITENIIHLVLAKIPASDGTLPQGSTGLSLFIVPAVLPSGERNDIAVAGLNHKMGNRGTANCLLNFGERDGAVGWRIGKEGDGLRQMFMMMNEARISVGLCAAAIATRGYHLAVDYAKGRVQGRVGNAGSAPVPIIEHADVKAMLLAQKCYAEGSLALCFYGAALVDREHEDPDSAALLALLIPVIKTWPSEFGLKANDLAIQVHGGYGYTRDFDVEQLYRDNRLNPIHEGTTGIQGIDLVARKILRPAKGWSVLNERIHRTIDAARANPDLQELAGHLSGGLDDVERVKDAIKCMDEKEALANATSFLFAFGHLVLGWLWLDLAVAACERADRALGESDDLAPGKVVACKYFYAYEMPRVAAWLSCITGRECILEAPTSVF